MQRKLEYQLIHSDAISAMMELRNESVDMIFVDPPYFLSNGGITCKSGKMKSVNKGYWDKSVSVDEDREFHLKWLIQCERVLKHTGTIWISGTYHCIYQIGSLLPLVALEILNDIAWFKPNAAPNLACNRFAASHETLLWCRKRGAKGYTFDYEAMKYFDACNPGEDEFKNPGKQMRSVWSIPTPPPKEKRHGKHPTQKPLTLLDRIVASSAKEGDLILDPFCGSGTCGVAATQMGMRYVGIDINQEYLDIAKKRIEDDCYN